MRLDLKKLNPGDAGEAVTLPFEGTVDLSEIVRFGEHPFPEAVRINGEAVLQHGEYRLRYHAAYTSHQRCARCLELVTGWDEHDAEHYVSIGDRDDLPDSTLSAPGGVLDLGELVATDLSLQLEGVTLCRDSCRGLCPLCGANRNDRDCGCEQESKPTDPRFDALKRYLEEQ